MAFRLQTGGRKAPVEHRPNEVELVSLSVALAMVLRLAGGKWTKQHAQLVADEVRRSGGTSQNWTPNEVCAHTTVVTL